MEKSKIVKGCPESYTEAAPKRFRYMSVAELEAFFAQFDVTDEEAHEMAEAAILSRKEVV